MEPAEDLLSLDLPCSLHAPVVVRDALSEIHNGDWSLDDGRLVASELVTNAVRHSGCDGGHHLKIEVCKREGRLLISVHDPGLSGQAARPQAVRPRVGDGTDPGGWGLHIVEQLSETWGTERPDGYRVWAELSAQA
jgi:anti-sigma regulatory factor (Ser/Thr protein kinase)